MFSSLEVQTMHSALIEGLERREGRADLVGHGDPAAIRDLAERLWPSGHDAPPALMRADEERAGPGPRSHLSS